MVMTNRARWTSSIVAVLGIAGTVGVLLAMLAMADGFRHTLVASGSPSNALIMRAGSNTEMVGAVKGIDPQTGHYFDDTKRYIDQLKGLSEESRYKIFEGNARRVYPRLDALLTRRGHTGKKA